MEKWKKRFDDWLGGGDKGERRPRLFRWFMLVGLVGALFMIINQMTVKEVDPITAGRASPQATTDPDIAAWKGQDGGERSLFREYEQTYESRLKELLQKIVGVGAVEVLVTIDSTEEMVVEKNMQQTQQTTNEKDQTGATRHITDVSSSGEVTLYTVSGDQAPVVVKYVKPKVRGVVVVAMGAENLTVKKLLIEAVARGLDVTPNRISVIPRKKG